MIAPVADASQVGEARRSAAEFARRAAFSDTRIAQVALVATEMATNLLKHGGGGEIVIDRFEDGDGRGMELLALDRGRGIADLQRCLADGFSMTGSPGTGLGAIFRQSDRFAAYSRPGLGTAIMARFGAATTPARMPLPELGAVVVPYPGESVCGDKWAFGAAKAGATLLVVDGSGHGAPAARAAETAAAAFLDHLEHDCVRLVETIHRALAPTRGAALAVARIDMGERLIRFVGVGNISAAMVSDGEVRRMVSHNGTAGHIAPRIREFTYPFSKDPLVLCHSDGLSAKWDLAGYPGLVASHPALIAGVLFRDHRRGRDDASVVAMRAAS